MATRGTAVAVCLAMVIATCGSTRRDDGASAPASSCPGASSHADIGRDTLGSFAVGNASECCTHCHAVAMCRAWVWSNKSGPAVCALKGKVDGGSGKLKPWVISGVLPPGPPPPPPPPPSPSPPPPPPPGTPLTATVTVAGGRAVFEVEEHYASYTIDLSAERGFFRRDLANPKLQWLARQLAPAVLRVGGSGGDKLFYDVPHDPGRQCPPVDPGPLKCKNVPSAPSPWARTPSAAAGARPDASPSPAPSNLGATCLNTSQWDALNRFALAAGAKLVFGLNFFLDPADESVLALLRYTAVANYTLFGLEYGNEQIKAGFPQCERRQAAGAVALHRIIAAQWPVAAERPRLIGPDAGGFSSQYVADVAGNDNGTQRLFGYTFHEYAIGHANSTSMPPSRLIASNKIAGRAAELRKASPNGDRIQLWAGEAGGSGGGGMDGITNSFASGQWYLDSLGQYARSGTSVFCRQDLVGAFYGLLQDGCPFGGLNASLVPPRWGREDTCLFAPPEPMPDYWSALLWKKLLGTVVLAANVSESGQGEAGAPWLRAYGHCAATGPAGAVAVVLINTHNSSAVQVSMAGVGAAVRSGASASRLQWHMTPVGGDHWGGGIELNGQVLRVLETAGTISEPRGWELPPLDGHTAPAPAALEIGPGAYSFLVFPAAGATACGAP